MSESLLAQVAYFSRPGSAYAKSDLQDLWDASKQRASQSNLAKVAEEDRFVDPLSNPDEAAGSPTLTPSLSLWRGDAI